MPDEEVARWEREALQRRVGAKARGSPLDKLLTSFEDAEDVGGPWGLSSRRGNLPGDWPLHSLAVETHIGAQTLVGAASVYREEKTVVWQETAEVYDADTSGFSVCHPDECICNLNDVERHRYDSICEALRLALRYSGLPEKCVLCFEFACGLEVRWALIGNHQWTHTLRCEFLELEKLAHGTDGFELAMTRECEGGWPKIASETKFVLSLVSCSSNPWHIYGLRTVSDQVWSFNVLERTYINVEEMRAKEATRLETMFALRLLKKTAEPDPKKKKKGRGKGRAGTGRGRGRGRGRGQAAASESEPGTEESEDSEVEEPEPAPPPLAPPPLAPPPPPLAPPPLDDAAAGQVVSPPLDETASGQVVPPPPAALPKAAGRPGGRQPRGIPWGRGQWAIATIEGGGIGAFCKDHIDVGSRLICKRHTTIGRSGLTEDDLRLSFAAACIVSNLCQYLVDETYKYIVSLYI